MDEARNTSTVNVAVAGVGYWGKNLVRNFHDLGALSVPASSLIAPADHPDAFTVGAVSTGDALRGYSSRGPTNDNRLVGSNFVAYAPAR